jgi:molybdate transport system substrate-binding protein
MRIRLSVLWAVLLLACTGARAADESAPVLVFGAASLTNVLDDLSQAFTASTKIQVKDSYAASSVLAKQIEAGAPADVFFSADLEWMDYLDQHKLIKAGSRHDVVGNKLVLIAPADSKVTIKLTAGVDLKSALGTEGKLATGDPDSVPVGKYAKAALQKLGAWDKISAQIASAENVRAALAFVARGEAPLGIVYRTDALAEKKVRIVAEFPADSYPPITYPIAITTHGGASAEKFEEFTRSKASAEIFRKYGFEPLH